MSANVSTTKKSFCRKDLERRWHKCGRTIRRMQKPGHRFHLPKPDMGDRWSEDLILDIERKWRGNSLAALGEPVRVLIERKDPEFAEEIRRALRETSPWRGNGRSPPGLIKSGSLPALAKVLHANYDVALDSSYKIGSPK
jgi:hypothetical protein